MLQGVLQSNSSFKLLTPLCHWQFLLVTAILVPFFLQSESLWCLLHRWTSLSYGKWNGFQRGCRRGGRRDSKVFLISLLACLAKWQPRPKLALRRQNLSGQPCGCELAKRSLPSSWHLHLNILSKRRVTCLSLSLTHFLPPSLYPSLLLSLGSAVCLSLTVDWVEAHVWHASISRETVQLPQLTMFKPCQLLIHLPSKLCIHRVGLLRVMIFPFWHRAVSRPARLQSEGRLIQMPVPDRSRFSISLWCILCSFGLMPSQQQLSEITGTKLAVFKLAHYLSVCARHISSHPTVS